MQATFEQEVKTSTSFRSRLAATLRDPVTYLRGFFFVLNLAVLGFLSQTMAISSVAIDIPVLILDAQGLEYFRSLVPVWNEYLRPNTATVYEYRLLHLLWLMVGAVLFWSAVRSLSNTSQHEAKTEELMIAFSRQRHTLFRNDWQWIVVTPDNEECRYWTRKEVRHALAELEAQADA